MILSLLTSIAFAGPFVFTVPGWKLATTLGPDSPIGGPYTHYMYSCPASASSTEADGDAIGGCLPSDGTQTPWAAVARNSSGTVISWPYVQCVTTLTDSGTTITGRDFDWVSLFVVYTPPVDGNGYTVQPSSFPASIECQKQMVGTGHIHTFKMPILNEDPGPHYMMPVVTTEINLSASPPTAPTVSITSAWAGNAGIKAINLPDGTYTGTAITTTGVDATTTAGGGTTYTGVACAVIEGTNDYLTVVVDRDTANSHADGNAWCRVVFNGNNKDIKIPISTP